MSDTYPKLRVAAVQAAPVYLDREATIEKACGLIREAGRNGAQFIAFPEGFVPGFPHWFDFYSHRHPVCQRSYRRLFDNAVEIPGPAIARCAEAAREAGAYVVLGVNERRAGLLGTLYNSQVFFGPEGLLGSRRKIMPTNAERLVHGMGDGTALLTIPTPLGSIGGLICGENGNPLTKFALSTQGERLHAGSWPAKTRAGWSGGVQNMLVRVQACAMEVGHVGVHAAGIFTDEMADVLEVSPEQRAGLLRGGGSCIVAPSGQVVAGPAGDEETILYAEVDLGDAIAVKQNQDFAGHYNRFDLFQVTLNVEPQVPLRLAHGPEPAPSALALNGESKSVEPARRR